MTKLPFNHFQGMQQWAGGTHLSEVASSLGMTCEGLRAKWKRDWPKEYEEAKKANHVTLACVRNAKYRRTEAEAVDRMKAYIEGIDIEDIDTLRAEIKNIASICEQAAKRADLMEGKATERSEVSNTMKIVSWKEATDGDDTQ